jgi:hypothetical protein
MPLTTSPATTPSPFDTLANGARLGWPVLPEERAVEI